MCFCFAGTIASIKWARPSPQAWTTSRDLITVAGILTCKLGCTSSASSWRKLRIFTEIAVMSISLICSSYASISSSSWKSALIYTRTSPMTPRTLRISDIPTFFRLLSESPLTDRHNTMPLCPQSRLIWTWESVSPPFPSTALTISKTKVQLFLCRCLLERASVDQHQLPLPARLEALLSRRKGLL